MTSPKPGSSWMVEFLTLSFLLVLTRIGDGLLTHAITPDLSREVNPIASILGLGWFGLITVAVIVLAGVIWLNYLSLTRPFPVSNQLAQSWDEYRKHYFDLRRRSDIAGLFIRVTGYSFPRALIAWSLLLIVHNTMVLWDFSWYRLFLDWGGAIAIYLALPGFCLYWIHLLQRRDYGFEQTQWNQL